MVDPRMLLGHLEVGDDRVWNLRFYRDFHDWELEAVYSFLEFTEARIPRGAGYRQSTLVP